MTRYALVLPLATAGFALTACTSGATTSSAPPTTAAPVTSTAAAPSTSQTVVPKSSTGTPSAANPSATATRTGTQPSAQPTGGACGTTTAAQAVSDNIGKLPPLAGGNRWSLEAADLKGYDPCAPLSYVPIGIHEYKAGSPWQIMLFHQGEFLGTATEKSYLFRPVVERLSPTSIQVTYQWAKPGENNANPTGRSVATFTYDEAQKKVVMTGEVPPQA